jgi:SAM-dependent methyltransferase
VWLPRFVCPECHADLDDAGDVRACAGCGRSYRRDNGVWRFLSATRGLGLEPFVRQYRAVREQEDRFATSPEYYRRLPSVASDDPHAGEWRIRRETYHHLLQHVLAAGPQPVQVLDLGAGTGWLSHRLSALGHDAVAVDAIDDETDGLGATRHYATAFAVVHADFNALPFAPGQFDLVVFNGSLHYATDTAATLENAYRQLAPGGVLVVMDSPMFRADSDGAAMVDDKVRHFMLECGLHQVVRQGIGYLTFAMLTAIADKLELQAQFLPSHGSAGWRLRRSLARIRLRRAPAAFGLWVAR